MQFKAGYIVDTIAKVISNFKAQLNSDLSDDETKLDQINGLLQYVSSFDVEFLYTHTPNFRELNPVLATLNNIITRGLPTRAPVCLEKLFSDIGLTEPNKDEFEFNFPYRKGENKDIAKGKNEERYKSIFELLHIIEPQLEIPESNYAGKPGSKLEWLFLHEKLKDYPFTKQILQSQRDFATINHDLGGGKSVDFSFEFPYLNTTGIGAKRKGIIFEYDGRQHKETSYKYYDKYRDDAASKEGFDTLRQSSDKIELDPLIIDQFKKDIFKILENNFAKNINNHLAEYSLIFIPLAVARIQKTILEYLLVHPELFKKEKIEIAIIERDLPCGAIAIKGLQDLIFNINAILEDKDKLALPEISLTIFENSKWVINEELHLQARVEDESFFAENNFDIILDHSILRRSNIYNEPDFRHHRNNTIKIRSAHYFDTSVGNARRVYCANLLDYKPLVNKKDDGSYSTNEDTKEYINFFIQNIFRKVSFREGQLPIISRALQQKPVIGLLPTGGGKSLTFQLPTFLQPGLCLVVDPIKSLMEDQVRVLKENWIDCCDFINSNLKKREEKTKKLIDFRYGETMFLFVSPERLVMQDFRYIIKNIDTSDFGLAFSYCVIDEVHCVSEWGHDFRTTYLMLGKNAQRFAKTKSKKAVSLIGLTATASFDVLTDIERELNIESDDVNDAVISIDNTIRPELFFSVIENMRRVQSFPIKSQDLKDEIGSAKQSQINEHIEGIIEKLNSITDEVVTKCLEQHFKDFELNIDINSIKQTEHIKKTKKEILKQIEFQNHNDVISIIFCPHRTGSLGITQDANPFPNNKELFENLVIPFANKGYFMGSDDKIKEKILENIQKYFLKFMIGKINYMICTKAFGMGIDKENIRSICHINFSSSPESYIQEAGRAGRDKAKSICTIFLDRNIYYTVSRNYIIENSPDSFHSIADRKEARAIFEKYDSFQNRLSEMYYGDIYSIKQNFQSIGIDFDEKYILSFNQDLSIHEYFHSNSFKGIEAEIFQLNRFINYKNSIDAAQLESYQRKCNKNFDDEISFYLTPNGLNLGNLWLKSNNVPFGKILTNTVEPTFTTAKLGRNGIPDLAKTKDIYNFLMKEWKDNGNTKTPLFNFFRMNNNLSLIEYFEKEDGNFIFKIPGSFSKHNLENELITNFGLKPLPIFEHHNPTAKFIETLKTHSSNFEDFILRIEEQWNKYITTNPIYIKNRIRYKEMYYSEIDKSDVYKIIYRLNSIGLIDDYTIDYNLGIFTINVIKQKKEYYIDKTQSHLLRYLSRAATMEKIEKLTEVTLKLSVFETIKECVKEILLFTYDDIVKKRKDAVIDLSKFISESLDQSIAKENNLPFKDFWYNYHLKDEMYYYFNAKYARMGFTINNEPYSLLDDTEKGQISNWETFEKYAKILNKQPSFISECKMMRGSCRRIWRTLSTYDNEREYILKLLSSFATFGLNNNYYYQEAEDLFIKGFIIFYNQHKDYKLLKNAIYSFEMYLLISVSDRNYIPYLNLAKHKIMLSVNRLFTETIISKLKNK